MEIRFDHILVPVDFTPQSEAAIEVAKQVAVQNAARVTLLHVIESIDFSDDEEIRRFLEKAQQQSREKLNQLRSQFDDSDLEVNVETTINHRSRGIVAYAMEQGVDLIVMTSHPIDPSESRDDWATISYQVSLVCPCSIMLIKA